MLDIAPSPPTVKVRTSGLCCHNPPEAIVRLGQEAMARQRRRWEDWLLIGEALESGRTEIMRNLHLNQPAGPRFEKAMGAWLVANKFNEVDKGVRCRLLECLRHRDEIEKWRAVLTDSERFRFNHPDAVLRRWKAATVVPDPNAPPKASPYSKLKDAHVQLMEEHHRLEQKIKAVDGDLWKASDTAADIAEVMLATLSLAKAERTAREILRKVKEQRALRERDFTGEGGAQ